MAQGQIPKLGLLGIGTATPRHAITQRDAAHWAQAIGSWTQEQLRLLPTVYARSRVQARYSVLLEQSIDAKLKQHFFQPAHGVEDRGPTTAQRMQRYAQEAAPLALAAATRALTLACLDASRVSHLVTISCTGFAAPGIDIYLMKALNLRKDLSRTHIGFMGCHGVFNGLQVASAILQAYPEAHVLLTAVELCSLHFCYEGETEKLMGNALFADGAGAAVLGHSPQESRLFWKLAASGSNLFPDSEQAITWHIGDHGFEMTLSRQVPEVLSAHLEPWMAKWLATQGYMLEDIRSWAVHPGGPRVLNTVADALGLSAEALGVSSRILSEYGNMSSPTILFILEQLLAQKAPKPCVALAFGPGLSAEAALFI